MKDWRTVNPETLERGEKTDLLIADVLGLQYGPVVNTYGRTVGYHLLDAKGQVSLDRIVPMWTRDIETALRLWGKSHPLEMRFFPHDGEWRVHNQTYFGRSPSLALALCQCWLMRRQDAQCLIEAAR